MKSREPKKKRTGKKQIWYGAAGLFCLAAAVLILMFGNGMGAQAESRTEYKIEDLEPGADGIYSITTTKQLLALGNADVVYTKGKTFKLTNDLTISSITTAATGTFAGTFDGNGHVITITKLRISDSTPGEAAQGVLFGKVTGSVKNLIVDIKDENASYTRTSDAGVTESERTESSWNSGEDSLEQEPKPYMESPIVSELDTKEPYKTAYAQIEGYTDIANGKELMWQKENTTTTTKTANAAGEDSFGIICGELSEGGSIEQVLVNGKDLEVTQKATEYKDAVATTTRTTTETVTYSKEKNYEFTDNDNKTVTLPAPDFYAEKVQETGTNKELEDRFSIKVSAPAYTVANENGNEYPYSIDYTVTVKPLDNAAHTLKVTALLKGVTGGTWTADGAAIENNSINLTVGEQKEIKFTYTGSCESDSANVRVSFQATEKVENQSVTAETAEVATFVNRQGKAEANESTPAVGADELKVEIAGPNEIGTAAASLSYTVTVKNNTTVDFADVKLNYNGTDWTVQNHSGNSISVGTLQANTEKKYTFTRTGSFTTTGAAPSLTVSASATKKTENASQELTVEQTKTTTVKRSPGNASTSKTAVGQIDGNNALKVEITGRDETAAGGSAGSLVYTVEITNLTDQKLISLKLDETSGNQWKMQGTVPTELTAGSSTTVTFSNTTALTADDSPSLTVTASAETEASTADGGIAGEDIENPPAGATAGTTVTTGPCTKITTVLEAVSSENTPVSGGNTSVAADRIKLKVSVPGYTEKNSKIIYTVEVTGKSGQTITLSNPSALTGGTWYEGGQAFTGTPEISFTEDGTKTCTYRVTPPSGTKLWSVNAGSLTAAISGSSDTLKISIPEVQVYDETPAESVEAKNETIGKGELQFTASAPAVTEVTGGRAEITYTISGLTDGSVLAAVPSGGSWSGTGDTLEDGSFKLNGERDITYTLIVADLPSGTDKKTVTASFTASKVMDKKTLYAGSSELSTAVYAENATLKTVSAAGNKEILEVTLETPAYTTKKNAVYTLTLRNTSKDSAYRIYIGKGSDDWNLNQVQAVWDKGSYTSTIDGVESDVLTGYILAAGDEAVITRSAGQNESEQTVVLSGIKTIREVTAYCYTGSNTGEEVKNESTGNPSIAVANSLSAGVITGKSSGGSITEISQQVNLKAAAATGIAENGASLNAGGIAGRTGNTKLQDLYVRGSIRGGNYLLGTGTVTELQNVIVTGTSDVANLGVSNPGDSVLAGISVEPPNEWINWKKYSYYQSESDQVKEFDLGWLVKEDAFSVTAPSGTQTAVQAELKRRLSESPLSWHMAYRARQKTNDQNRQLYYCENQKLELGKSGYYQIENLYATDGYYHYLQGAEENTHYPFAGDMKPVFYEENDWSVVRTDRDSLQDQIQVRLKEEIATGSCIIYYYDIDTNSWKEAETLSDNGGREVKAFPFDAADVKIRILPQLDNKFYEEEEEKDFGQSDHLPLPAPRVTISDFYKEDGTANVVDFADQAFYGQGSELDITDVNTKCSYQYYLSDKELLESGWITTQPEHNTTGYTVNTGAFEGVEWKDISDEFKLSDEEGTWYLYVKVEAAGYPSTIYRYGSCTTCQKATADIHVYLDDGTELAENDRIASGDSFKFRFTVTEAEKLGMTRLQYLASATELSGENLHLDQNWTLYEDTAITINRPSGADGYYIYARIYNAEAKKYQEVDTYHYLFVDEAGTVTISPRTVSVESASDASAASTISSSSPVYLSCQEEGARILYLISDSPNNKFSFVRVTENLSGLTDGENGYFKIGNRWYRTDASVQVYTDSISFYNGESSTKTQYIHTAVLGTEGEPGKTVTYAYQVSPMGQAAAPEASMDTLHFPGGEDKDSTKVQKGASLSFQSLTPGAELYYVVGDGSAEVLDHEEGETKLYDSKNGIEVEGDYGNQFVIRMKAVKWSTDGTGRKELKDSETVRFIYTIADQDQAVAPTATPATSDAETTVIRPGDKILLSTPTKGASIYYTTDGSEPKVAKAEDGTFTPSEGTLLYDAGQGIIAPSSGNGYFTVRAIAVHPDLSVSPEAKYTYSFPSEVETPYANIPSGDVDMGTEIILKNKTEGADIYYTVSRDGSTPADPTISSSVFDAAQPIIVNGATVIKAIAVKDGVKSGILTLTYNSREQLSAPTASIDSGAMVSRGTRLKLKAADGASIYYTMDGSDPSDQSNASVISGSELILDGAAGSTVTVKACARKDGKSVSEVVTFTYQISQSAGGVTADVPNGTLVSIGSKINLMTDVTGAEIRYTTDGSSPADNGIKGTVVTVEGISGSSFMIKAVAVVDGDAGTVCTFTYKIKEKPSAPTASPSGGTLTVATRVELNSSAEKIYYTTDGVEPTESSTLYKEPILINKTTNLKAIAVSADGEVSEVASFQYTAALKAEKPTASHDTGTVLEPGTIVALHTATSGAEIYYSTNGTEPTRDNLDSMTLYTEDGITVNRTVTILAVAYREDMQLSAVTELYYQVDTIPAVEQKKAEEALLEEQQLKDTDSSELERTEEQQQGTSYQSRVLRERDYNTVVSSTWESIPSDAVLVTEKQDYAQEALSNVRQLFGDDYTIISSYDMYLMRGSTIAQPQGEVEIGIPIPETYENAAVTIVYIDKNNKITKKETRRQDGMAYAKTDHFSNYALVGLEEAATGGWTLSYLLVLETAAAVTVIAGLAYYISRKWKKMKRDR